MKSFAVVSLLAVCHAECLSGWTTVTVDPPAEACCTTAWDTGTCDVLQDAVDAAVACTILELNPGRYCNKNWYK